MKSKITILLCLLLVFTNSGSFAQAGNSKDDGHNIASNDVVTDTSDNQEAELRNYIGFTPTLILFGMYGLVYGYALNNNIVLIAMAGYTNFDLIPIKFLRDWMRNDNYLYQNIYCGMNITFFPFSEQIFPQGFYFGFDFVPTLNLIKNRQTGATGSAIGFTFDTIVGYSWIFGNLFKLSVDAFLSVNTPDLYSSGENMNADNNWVIMPFFDINIGFVF